MSDDHTKNREEQTWSGVRAVLGEEVIGGFDAATRTQLQELIFASARNHDLHSPSRELMSLLGDRWSPLLLSLLDFGSLRFSTLQRVVAAIDDVGISRRMLSFTLRALEREGYVTRQVVTVVPPNVEYSLSEMGKQMCARLMPLLVWGEANAEQIRAARKTFADKDVS